MDIRFRPLIRGFFFYPLTETVSSLRRLGKVSVPLFGDSFFMVVIRPTFSGKYAVVSVPLFGDSFYIRTSHRISSGWRKCFRPLIRGFFFYDSQTVAKAISGLMFPSPYSGILFLLKAAKNKSLGRRTCFRPLIRGFFFYDSLRPPDIPQYQGFRPLIRGFFFYAYMV